MKQLRRAAIGLGALTGLALLIGSGQATTAVAAQVVEQNPAKGHQIAARLATVRPELSGRETLDRLPSGYQRDGALIQGPPSHGVTPK